MNVTEQEDIVFYLYSLSNGTPFAHNRYSSLDEAKRDMYLFTKEIKGSSTYKIIPTIKYDIKRSGIGFELNGSSYKSIDDLIAELYRRNQPFEDSSLLGIDIDEHQKIKKAQKDLLNNALSK